MAFDEFKENTANIQEHAKDFIESNIAYYKLRAFKTAMKSMTMMIKFALILLSFGLVLLFCSVAAALALGSYFHNNALGFLSIGGFYLIISGFLFLVKDKIVEGPLLEKFSEIFFND